VTKPAKLADTEPPAPIAPETDRGGVKKKSRVIPIVAEQLTDVSGSIYEVKAPFKPIWMWGKDKPRLSLKWVCWPQHVSFVAGILVYAAKH